MTVEWKRPDTPASNHLRTPPETGWLPIFGKALCAMASCTSWMDYGEPVLVTVANDRHPLYIRAYTVLTLDGTERYATSGDCPRCGHRDELRPPTAMFAAVQAPPSPPSSEAAPAT